MFARSVSRGRSGQMSSRDSRFTKIEQGVFPSVFYQDCFASSWIFLDSFPTVFSQLFFASGARYYLINVDRYAVLASTWGPSEMNAGISVGKAWTVAVVGGEGGTHGICDPR